MNTISFITANFVAREVAYNMTEGWMQGENATHAFFKPLETFAVRFEVMLLEIKAMGFSALDLWAAHLHPDWASKQHLEVTKTLLEKHNLTVGSIATWFPDVSTLERFCIMAVALNVPMLAGSAPLLQTARAEALAVLRRYKIVLAIENHPETSPNQILEQIGTDTDVLGAAADTGWWATQGADPAEALRALGGHLCTVHLKDVLEVGAHNTCRFGQGVAKINECVTALKAMNYQGTLGIEHEPEHFNPTQDVLDSQQWLLQQLKEHS